MLDEVHRVLWRDAGRDIVPAAIVLGTLVAALSGLDGFDVVWRAEARWAKEVHVAVEPELPDLRRLLLRSQSPALHQHLRRLLGEVGADHDAVVVDDREVWED